MTRRLAVMMLLASVAVGLAASIARAGRPLIVDDAGTVEQYRFELEAGVSYSDDSATDHFDFPIALTYGLLSTLEIGIGLGGQLEEREEQLEPGEIVSGFGDLNLGAKWNPVGQESFVVAQALAFTVKFPTASSHNGLGSGHTDYDVTWIATRQINDQWSADLNVGYTWIGEAAGEDLSDVLHYGVSVQWQVSEKWQPVIELDFETPVSGGKTAVGLNGGVRYTLIEPLVLDAAIGTGLAGEWPTFTATVGLTWTF